MISVLWSKLDPFYTCTQINEISFWFLCTCEHGERKKKKISQQRLCRKFVWSVSVCTALCIYIVNIYCIHWVDVLACFFSCVAKNPDSVVQRQKQRNIPYFNFSPYISKFWSHLCQGMNACLKTFPLEALPHKLPNTVMTKTAAVFPGLCWIIPAD